MPDEFEEADRRACAVLFRGPRGWLPSSFLSALRHLRSSVGIPDIQGTALAAQCRVAMWEDHCKCGLRVDVGFAALRRAYMTCNFPDWDAAWSSWWDTASVHQLAAATLLARTRGYDPAAMLVWLAGAADGTDRESAARKNWQRECAKIVRVLAVDGVIRHLRRQPGRFELAIVQGHRVSRAISLLQRLSAIVPPRVWHASFRTLLDGWATAERMGGCATCISGCAARDGLRHFCFVPRRPTLLQGRARIAGAAAWAAGRWPLGPEACHVGRDEETVLRPLWRVTLLILHAVARDTEACAPRPWAAPRYR
ncbi:unnamed protein product [Prorocentrum cordatum]|uniref:Uncharacterized protein n=1 Tax=Prorocentrum cordatum TaxID=2364126 RepID=A0ABN9TPH6_9DINO|nr:unnamed protein product [Polarella glacialis]